MSQSKPLKEHSVPSRVQGGSDHTLVEQNDRFVLDSVDGLSSAEELAFLLGLNFEDVAESLHRLAAIGLVLWEAEVEPDTGDSDVSTENAPELNPSTAVTAAFETIGGTDAGVGIDTVPVEVLSEEGAALPAQVDDFGKLAEEISARSTGDATSDFSVTDLLDQMSNSTVSVAAVPTAKALADLKAAGPDESIKIVSRSELEEALSATPLEPIAPVDRPSPPAFPKRRDASDPALTLTPSVPIEAVDVGFIPTPRRSVPPTAPQPVQSQDRIPTSSHPIVPAVPVTSANRLKGGGELRGVGPATPRRHLDTSWWSGTRASAEPDEVLTAREVSFSGPMPADSGAPPMTGSGELRPSLSQTPQRLERPPGGFLRPRLGTGEVTDSSKKLEGDDITAELEALHGEDVSITIGSPVDEVAHARNGSPLLPDIEPDEGYGETLQMIRPLSGLLPIESVEPAIPDSKAEEAPFWSEEPIRPSLKGGFGGWDEARARRVSWYLRTVQGGTYYELLGLPDTASTDDVVNAARDLRAGLDMGSLHHSADASGLEALSVIDKGISRALDVLSNPDARAAYDAALAALAAFKV